ncbi:MAG: ABC-2 family transporter protein [Eubacteriales bacterium]|nr:ABC-2 family transporter protein [Eubacteriales bacterium]
MKKYLYALSLGIKETMAYRADFWLGIASAAFPIIIQVFMWQALYSGSGGGALFGRSYAQMLAYSVSASILWRLLKTGFEYEINEDIKNGGLSKYIVRPIEYLPYRLHCFLGQKIGVLFSGLMLMTLALTGVGLSFHVSPVSLQGVLLFLPTLLGALVLNFLIFFCVGMWAFWLSEIGFLFEAVRIVIVVLSGGIFPLEVFGTAVGGALKLLPFTYAVGFPVDVLTGTVTGPAVLTGLCFQLAWIGLMVVISRFLWNLGSRKYLAAGG